MVSVPAPGSEQQLHALIADLHAPMLERHRPGWKVYFIDGLAAFRDRIQGAVSSSEQSTARLRAHGIDVLDLNAAGTLALYVDGADECDPHNRLIKRGGLLWVRKQTPESGDRPSGVAL